MKPEATSVSNSPTQGGGICRHLYVHVPFCTGKCAYCAFHSNACQADTSYADYLAGLERELAEAAVPLQLSTVYFGGGTPTALPPDVLAALLKLIRTRAPLSDGSEWTVETHPATLTAEKLALLLNAGVNRISIGAQCFDDEVLRRLNRRHTVADTLCTVQLVRDAGITNVGIDLIAGLPGITPEGWQETLTQTIGLELAHVSVYGLSVEPDTQLAREGFHSDEARILDDLALAESCLPHERYEVSNYALPGLRCRHNLACWQGADYLGIGPAAASRIGTLRKTNAPYEVRDTFTPAEDALERFIFQFRLHDGVDLNAYPQFATCAPLLQRFATEGLTRQNGTRWRLTPRGFEVLDSILVELMKGLT